MISRSFTEISRRNLLHMFSLLGLTAFSRGTGAATDPARINAVPDDAGRTRRFLIDTDTASDDAVALVMALRNPGVSVEAITVVAGNMPIEKGLQNALYTRDLCGSHAPVYRGCGAPLLRPLHTAEYVHGNDGFGDIGLPLTGRTPAPGHAVPAIIDVINRHAGEITLVTLGPLTNIALALKIDPTIAQKVTRCVIMGGVG
ncbi:MAG: nucleoside hydrolase, partial [Candidatus Acidiferrales bacterium]